MAYYNFVLQVFKEEKWSDVCPYVTLALAEQMRDHLYGLAEALGEIKEYRIVSAIDQWITHCSVCPVCRRIGYRSCTWMKGRPFPSARDEETIPIGWTGDLVCLACQKKKGGDKDG